MRMPWAGYSLRSAQRDVVAGLTVAAVALPQAIAYALIAGVDPKYGVYSAIVVTAIASIFGSSSHLINGPTSAISLLVFSSLAFIDPANRTVLFESLFVLGVLVGVIQILIAVFKLGDLTRYISESVVLGFMLAAATLIAIGQLKNAFGVRDSGTGHNELARAYQTLVHGDPYNLRALALTASAIGLALLLRRIVRRFGLPQIDLLAALLLTSLIGWLAGWTVVGTAGSAAVRLTPEVPQSLPSFHVPVLQSVQVAELAQSAVTIALIGSIEALSIAKSIAQQTHQRIDYNRQILAEGLGNLAGGFFQSVPGSGSFSRSAINFQSGGATRFSGVVSAAAVTVALLLFAPLLRYVPQAALAGLLLITAVRLVDVPRLRMTLRASRYDAGLVIVTALTGLLLDLDKAVLIGVVVSIVLFVPRAARLRATELIVTPEGVVRERAAPDLTSAGDDVPDQRTVIYDLEGELFFGAAPELERYLAGISERVRAGNVEFVVLRLKRARNPDAVSIEHLANFLKAPPFARPTTPEEGANGRQATVLLAGVRPDTLTILRNIGFEKWFPPEQVFPEEEREFSATLHAVRYAYARLAERDGDHRGGDATYYLV